jgi:Cd2+/Zn2+-exporting ATPase
MEKPDKEKKANFLANIDTLLIVLLLASLVLAKYEALTIAVGIIATVPVVISALRALKNRKISIDLLASVALVVSLINKEWVSAALINLMITSARIFSRYVEIKSHSAIQGLLKSKPTRANVERDGKIISVPIEEVKIGDLVAVGLGEKIPIDGIVEKGEATVDQSSLTGESIPVLKKIGDNALSFTNIASGNLTIRAEKIGKDTSFEKIIKLIAASQDDKAGIETIVDIFAKWYIVLSILVALVIYAISRDINLVLAVLLVSCADDVAVATPLALTTSIEHSATHGAIVKGGSFIEGLSKVKVMVFDKTGTLTESKLTVKKIQLFGGSEDEIIRLAATASAISHHPVAKALTDYAKSKNIAFSNPDKLNEYAGKGVIASSEGKDIIMGKASFFKEKGIRISAEENASMEEEMDKGYNITLIGQDGRFTGFIALDDTLRPNLKNIISEIKSLGVEKTVMLTGDNEKIAKRISEEIGIDEYYANLLPEDKTEHLKGYLNKKYKVAMVGDGVNDAPCIALSDIGIAMGVIGSDAAIESADIAMMRDDLSQIPELMKISRKTTRTIKQNMIVWAVTNVVGFVLVFAFALSPAAAAAYNFLTDFVPIINSLQLFR